MKHDKATVRNLLDGARETGRRMLTPTEAARLCEAYAIATPPTAIATSATEAVRIAQRIGYPVALKVVSADVVHKTDAGGVIVGVDGDGKVREAYESIVGDVGKRQPEARIDGVQVQRMALPGVEVIVGAVTDPAFGKLVAFGLGGVLVDVLADVTFRLAPIGQSEARAMLDDVAAAKILRGVRGARAVDTEALARVVHNVSQLVTDFPEIRELDLNPVFASADGAVAADVRVLLDLEPPTAPAPLSREAILTAMRRIMRPRAVAVIGASAETGKIGNSVMRNLVDGGYAGEIYPIHPKAEEILGKRCYRSVLDVAGDVDVAVFAIPARLVPDALEEVGRKGIAGAVMIPSGFAETGEVELQERMMEVARRHGVRVMGPNIYGFYYTPARLCATFCTPYDVRGRVAMSSQSGGVGMSIIGFSRSTKTGVSAIVGLGNKADLDEDDLLVFFEEDENTDVIVMHCEDLKDGRAFAETARRVTRKKPVVMLKAGRTAAGARAAASHTGALAGHDKVYDDVLRQCGVIRARTLNDMLQLGRALPVLPAPKGENVLILTGAGGSGVLLSDACVDNGLALMTMPKDLDEAFRKFIPPFGAAGNPVDITGGEPPSTYHNTIDLALRDDRIHAVILGYWHTIITPPMVFAELCAEVVDAARKDGIEKPIVASLVGDVEVEQASEYLFERGVVAYPYTTELPVLVLGAKYRWARAAGLLAGY